MTTTSCGYRPSSCGCHRSRTTGRHRGAPRRRHIEEATAAATSSGHLAMTRWCTEHLDRVRQLVDVIDTPRQLRRELVGERRELFCDRRCAFWQHAFELTR